MGHPDAAQAEPGRAPVHGLAFAEDLDVGDLAGRGRVVGVRRDHDRHGLLEVELGDQPGLTLVEVDGPGMRGGVGRGVVHRAEHAAGVGLDQPDRRTS